MIVKNIDLRDGKGKVYLIDTNALGNARAVACYLVVDANGKVVIVDTGYASSIDELIRSLNTLNIGIKDIDYIVPTHLHLDHSGSTGHIAKGSSAEIIAHTKAIKHLIDPSKLIASVKQVFGDYADLFGYPIAVDPKNNTITGVNTGEEHILSMGSVELRCMTAEGHAPHQIAVYINNGNEPILITADSVSMLYPDYPCYIPTTPPPAFDAEQAIATAERLSRLNAKMLLMPHFGISTEPDTVFKETVESIGEWVGMIRYLLDEGYAQDAIEVRMIEHVKSKSKDKGNGREDEPIPAYVINSIRNSVRGVINYLH
ncbi:MAG: MBL fold metallo-hydrolase [Candidatus Nitrosocaldus sp.]